MPNLLLFDPAIYPLLLFNSFIGVIAAILAKEKGYNFWLWLILGLIGGTVTLTVILVMKEKESV